MVHGGTAPLPLRASHVHSHGLCGSVEVATHHDQSHSLWYPDRPEGSSGSSPVSLMAGRQECPALVTHWAWYCRWVRSLPRISSVGGRALQDMTWQGHPFPQVFRRVVLLTMHSLSQARRLGGLQRASPVPFRASCFTSSVHPPDATAQWLTVCLYRRWRYPLIPWPRFVAHLVEDDLPRHATCVGLQQRLGDRGRGEAIGLHQNRALRFPQRLDDLLGTVAARGEAHGHAFGGE
jgi:hypothetical protein